MLRVELIRWNTIHYKKLKDEEARKILESVQGINLEDIKYFYVNFDRNERENKNKIWVTNLQEKEKRIELSNENYQFLSEIMEKEDIEMKETTINFCWLEKGMRYQKELKRDEVYAIFDGLVKGYASADNNEISKKLVQIIPEVDKIFINRDHNETQDVPFIVYYINDEVHILKIRNCHKIVWTILNEYCKY